MLVRYNIHYMFFVIAHILDKRQTNRMDETWIGLSRWTNKYIDGVDTFFDFAFTKFSSRGEIVWPWRKCNSILWQPCDYTTWFHHGEVPFPSGGETTKIWGHVHHMHDLVIAWYWLVSVILSLISGQDVILWDVPSKMHLHQSSSH